MITLLVVATFVAACCCAAAGLIASAHNAAEGNTALTGLDLADRQV